MPAPPNQTPATAIDLSPLPVALTIDVSALPGGGELWYRYTAGATDYVAAIGAVAAPGGAHTLVTAYSDAGVTLYLNINAITQIQMPVTPGVAYYLKISAVPGGSTTVALSLIRGPNLAVPAGSLLINDDTAGFPLVVLSPTDGTVQQFRPFPNGENADVLASGISLWGNTDSGTLELYDATLAHLATLPWTFGSDPPITSNRTTRFYVGDPGGGGASARVTSVTAAGAMGATIWTLPSPGLVSMAVSRDETVLYHYGQVSSADSQIRRWDLLNNVALTPLAAAVTSYASRKTMLVLADETIVVPYFKNTAPVDSYLRRYARDGTLLRTYPLGAVAVNHVSHALDDPASFWIWIDLTGASQGLAHMVLMRAADGVVLATLQTAEFEGGIYAGPTTGTQPLFGHSECCPFLMFPLALSAYAPSGGDGGGGTDGGGGGGTVPPPGTPGRIRRLRRAPHLSAEQIEQFFARLQIDLEAGVGLATDPGIDPQLYLRWSDDGGHTWRPPLAVSAGTTGQFRRRAIWRRLGRSRDRVFEVSMNDPVKWALLAAALDAQKGSS